MTPIDGYCPLVRRLESPLSLEQLIQRYSTEIGWLLRRWGVAPGDVDDARQRVWLMTVRALKRIHHGSERAFLRSVARGEASHVRRTYRRRSEVSVVALEPVPARDASGDEVLARRERLAEAHAALQELEEGLRRVLLRFELDEVPITEIAREFGIPTGTVKSRLRRARTELERRRARGAVG